MPTTTIVEKSTGSSGQGPSNVSSVQVRRYADIFRRYDANSQVYKNALADAIGELDRRSVSPYVTLSNVLPGTLRSEVAIPARNISGVLSAAQVGAINASSIVGLIDASQIGSVNATAIQGSITSSQIGSVNATTIQGVIVSSQLVDGIIDSLNKFSAPLRGIPTLSSAPSLPDAEYPAGTFYYNTTDSTFYENVGGTWTATTEGAATSGKLNYYFVGKVNVSSFIGLITAAQIGSVNAESIVGSITVGSGVTIEAGTITGTVTAGGPLTIDVGALTGTISSTGNVVVNGDSIQSLTVPGTAIIDGAITGAKIATATITNANIGDCSIDKLTAGTATFSGPAVFGYGTRKVTIDATSVKIEQSTSQYVRVSALSVLVQNDTSYVDVGPMSITLSGHGGGSTTLDATGVTITAGNSFSSQAQLTGSSLTFISNVVDPSSGRTIITADSVDIQKDTAHTVVSSSGIQIYGGTSGIGIGASTFQNSPLRITSTEITFGVAGFYSNSATFSNGELIFYPTVGSGSTSLSSLGLIVNPNGTQNYAQILPQIIILGGQQVLGPRKLAVPNATGLTDVVDRLNDLLARLRDHGLIAT